MDLYLERKDVEQLANKTFPSYHGKKFRVSTSESYRLHNYWDGGSREYFVLLRINPDGSVVLVDGCNTGTDNPFKDEAHQSIPIAQDMMVVVNSIFCGKDMGLTFYVHPNSILLPKLLPAPAELSQEEKVVLVATRSLKPCYAGDSNVRFHEARRWTGITQEQWDVAKASCTAKGYLNKVGAITIKGRNVAGHEQLHQLKGASLQPT